MTEKLTETDLFKMKTLSQPVAATDRYFVTQTRVDQESNDYRANILGFTKAGEFVGNFDNDNYSSKSPVVGANFLFFLSKKTADSTYQVFKVPFAGGTATQVSHFNHAVESLKVAPGTDTVYFKTRKLRKSLRNLTKKYRVCVTCIDSTIKRITSAFSQLTEPIYSIHALSLMMHLTKFLRVKPISI